MKLSRYELCLSNRKFNHSTMKLQEVTSHSSECSQQIIIILVCDYCPWAGSEGDDHCGRCIPRGGSFPNFTVTSPGVRLQSGTSKPEHRLCWRFHVFQSPLRMTLGNRSERRRTDHDRDAVRWVFVPVLLGQLIALDVLPWVGEFPAASWFLHTTLLEKLTIHASGVPFF